MLTDAPLVGRDEELSRLDDILRSTISGSGGLVLLSGEAGIGKTRLATEFENRARASGCKILVGNCLPSAQIPYMVFLDALNDLFKEEASERASRATRIWRGVKRAAPELAKEIPLIGGTIKASAALLREYQESGGDAESRKQHVLFKTLEMLRVESARRPLVMHLDDLQWADSASIGMLHFLARNVREMPILLLGTYRPEEVLNREGGAHPFLESLRTMRRENLTQELELKSLGEKQLNQVVSGLLERPVHASLLGRIFKESGGSPLFAVETVRLLESSGVLKIVDRKYTVEGSMDDLIPSSVKEVILRRIERTSREERRTLDYASIIGMTFDTQLLAGALRREHLRTLEELEDLSNQHQLVREIEIGYTFTHEKVRRFTYDSVSKARRKEVHRTIGLLMEKQLPNENLLPDLALHFTSANDKPKALKYSFLAGDLCTRRDAFVEAIPNFQRVLELGPGLEGFEDYRVAAMEGLGDAYNETGNAGSAVKLYEQMLEASVQGLQRTRVLRKLAFCYSPLKLGKGSKVKSLELAEQAQAIPEIDGDEQGEIASMLVVFAILEGNWDEAKIQARLSEEAFRRDRVLRKLALQLVYSSDIYISTGEMDKVLSMLKEAGEVNESIKNPVTQSEIDLRYGQVYMHRGQADEALKHFNSFIEVSKKLGCDSALSIAYYYQSILMSTIGNLDAAKELGEESHACAQRIGSDYLRAGAGAALAHVNYLLGESAECQRLTAEALEVSSKFGEGFKAPLVGMVLAARAEAEMASKEWGEADRLFREAIAMFDACLIGKLMGGLARGWYANALIEIGKPEEARAQLMDAVKIFEGLGNEAQKSRCLKAAMSIAT